MIDKIVAIFKKVDKWLYKTFPACITQSIIDALNNTLIFIDKGIWSILFRVFLLILLPLVIIDCILSALFVMVWQPFKCSVLFILGEYDDYY